MKMINNIGRQNIRGKFLSRKTTLAKNLNPIAMSKKRIASLPKTLGLMALLGISALSISAMANNRENKFQKTKTEITTQYACEEDSIISVQQKYIEENNRKIAELQNKAEKDKQIKQQEKIIRQQEQDIMANKINQKISDFYSENKKSIWGSAIGFFFLMFHLVGRHKIYSMEIDCPDNFFEPAGRSAYPFVNKIFYRRSESKNKLYYANYDNRNMIQKATDFLIDKGIHFTWSKGWTYTPIRTPKPADPIKEMLTWELKNKLRSIRMDISAAQRTNEQHRKDYDADNWLITKNIKILTTEAAKIEAELQSRGEI